MDWLLRPCLVWFGNLPIKAKLHISFGWLCLFTLILGLVCLGGMEQISRVHETSAPSPVVAMPHDGTVLVVPDKADTGAATLVRRFRVVVLSLLAFILLLDIVMAWRLTQIISGPILEAYSVLKSLSRHDLTTSAKVVSNDEVGQMGAALNETIAHLRGVMTDLYATASALQRSSEELALETRETNANCHEQSTLSQKVLDSTRKLVDDGSRIALNSIEAAEACRVSANAAGAGGDIMSHASGTMDEIAASSEVIQNLMQRLDGRSHEINKAVTVIRDISENTNLLALNAAIEAARAGEQGRGFAVVAGEVRRLAEHTRAATEEIGQMVLSIQQETNNTTAAVVASRSSILTGKQSTIEAQGMLHMIIERTNRTGSLTEETAMAAKGQSTSCAEIEHHATQVANLAGATREASEQAARTGETMHSLATQLNDLVHQFRL